MPFKNEELSLFMMNLLHSHFVYVAVIGACFLANSKVLAAESEQATNAVAAPSTVTAQSPQVVPVSNMAVQATPLSAAPIQAASANAELKKEANHTAPPTSTSVQQQLTPQSPLSTEPKKTMKAAPQKAPIIPLSTASELKNRFRIDHMVQSMTLLVQREYGSAPVVVVLPDGSKWYANRHPDSVKWVDGLAGDMITIESPQPGPWQLVGRVVPGSTIQKVSALEIEVQPLPQPLFQGEQISLIAHLIGDAERIRMPGLDYLVEWTASFVSKHKVGDENFAAGNIIVGAYKDNGEGYDQRPDDGVFTSHLNLKQPWGDYDFVVHARNNVFERQISVPFTLSPRPVEANILTPDDPLKGQWALNLYANSEVLRLSETHFSFELVGPAGLHVPLALQGLTAETAQILLPTVSEFGSYRIKGIAATTTVTGRELVLDLPEVFFNLVQPPEPPPSAEALAAIAAQQAAIEEQVAKDDALFWIITINAILLVLGAAALIVWRKRQTLAQALAAAEQRLNDETAQPLTQEPTLDDIDLTIPDETSSDDPSKAR